MREFPTAAAVGASRRRVFSVSTLNRRIKDLLESEHPQLWVEGEVSNLSRPRSGHLYFSLKDAHCQIRCALFRGRARHATAELRDGAQLLVRARLTHYEARGDTQLVVEELEDAGEGALRRAFEALKRKLAGEGLFDAGHKRPLPVLPRRVAIVTSSSGAALRDILATFRRRFPAIPLVLHPVTVQGDQAVAEICAALADASRTGACDVLILARGGGSLEDLQAFNDERVARAVFESPIPVVCGVGHESDVSICDFVADQRAATPTAAAELVSPDAREWLARVNQAEARLLRRMRDRLEQSAQRLDWLNRLIVHPRQRLRARAEALQGRYTALERALRARLQSGRLACAPLDARLMRNNPAARLAATRYRLESLDQRLRRAATLALSTRGQALERAVARLDSVNPLAVLARGYAVVREPVTRRVLRSVEQVAPEADIEVRLADGDLRCRVLDRRHDV